MTNQNEMWELAIKNAVVARPKQRDWTFIRVSAEIAALVALAVAVSQWLSK